MACVIGGCRFSVNVRKASLEGVQPSELVAVQSQRVRLSVLRTSVSVCRDAGMKASAKAKLIDQLF